MSEFYLDRYLSPENFERAEKVASIVRHLSNVMNDPELSPTYKEAAQKVAQQELDKVFPKPIKK